MRAFEVAKNGADIQRGRVMMCVEGERESVYKVDEGLAEFYSSCDYEEEAEKDGEISVFFMIDRDEKKDFMSLYKTLKKGVLDGMRKS